MRARLARRQGDTVRHRCGWRGIVMIRRDAPPAGMPDFSPQTVKPLLPQALGGTVTGCREADGCRLLASQMRGIGSAHNAAIGEGLGQHASVDVIGPQGSMASLIGFLAQTPKPIPLIFTVSVNTTIRTMGRTFFGMKRMLVELGDNPAANQVRRGGAFLKNRLCQLDRVALDPDFRAVRTADRAQVAPAVIPVHYLV
ncbi:hypothetical protein BamMEX5DRAFT_6631 [Burkholderia ambifaria MEX-5]|uniref:Uncharacterized protein n=1 Tax=Burkholderia ambifaria MEX-5 TaxID=396597 RepID=B1TFR5_9BURK|nr:hypothetical protein BamMEX5DRAFT_6631 [Burkholderia ambifaria MEX-5]